MNKKHLIIAELKKYRNKAIRQEIAEATIPEVTRVNRETADAILVIMEGGKPGISFDTTQETDSPDDLACAISYCEEQRVASSHFCGTHKVGKS